jgi:hypothetical protein
VRSVSTTSVRIPRVGENGSRPATHLSFPFLCYFRSRIKKYIDTKRNIYTQTAPSVVTNRHKAAAFNMAKVPAVGGYPRSRMMSGAGAKARWPVNMTAQTTAEQPARRPGCLDGPIEGILASWFLAFLCAAQIGRCRRLSPAWLTSRLTSRRELNAMPRDRCCYWRMYGTDRRAPASRGLYVMPRR